MELLTFSHVSFFLTFQSWISNHINKFTHSSLHHICEIWGFHGGEDNNDGVLGFGIM